MFTVSYPHIISYSNPYIELLAIEDRLIRIAESTVLHLSKIVAIMLPEEPSPSG